MVDEKNKTTADIDIVAKKPTIVKKALHELGFKDVSELRFVNEELGLIVE